MKILYGVVGEGMGHAMRSAVLLEALTQRGHEMRIVGSGRAAEYLERLYPDRVIRITGLTMVYEDNEVQLIKTALQNLKAARGLPENLRTYLALARDYTPDVVVSDFESWSYAFARGQKIPVISVDNMQIIARCYHDESVLGGDLTSLLLAKGIVKAKLLRANAYLITSFFYPRIKKDRTTLHPPILRRAILEAKERTRVGDHVLVYQSGTSHGALVDTLRRVDAPFRIYGLRRDLSADETDGNLTFCPFSEPAFIDDLASCRAVIAGGGFTLMGEAVTLGKPMLSVPLVGQFEQTLNAAYLEQLGYGQKSAHITPEVLRNFLEQAEMFRENLANFVHDDNRGVLGQLDQALETAVREGPLD